MGRKYIGNQEPADTSNDASVDEKISAANQQMIEIGENKKVILRDIESLNVTKVSIEKKIDALKSELLEMNNAKAAEKRALIEHRAEIEAEKKSLKNNIDSLVISLDGTKGQLEKLEKAVLALQNDEKNLKTVITSLEGQRNSIVSEISEKERKLSLVSKEIILSSVLLESKQSEADSLDAQIKIKRSVLEEISVKEQILANLVLSIKESEGKKVELRNEVNDLTSEVESKKAEAKRIEEESNEKLRILAIAEQKTDQKIQHAKALIEKGKAEGYIKEKS